MAYPDAAWERAMTVQEVRLKALSGEIHRPDLRFLLGRCLRDPPWIWMQELAEDRTYPGRVVGRVASRQTCVSWNSGLGTRVVRGKPGGTRICTGREPTEPSESRSGIRGVP
jgi:hypothetical protein